MAAVDGAFGGLFLVCFGFGLVLAVLGLGISLVLVGLAFLLATRANVGAESPGGAGAGGGAYLLGTPRFRVIVLVGGVTRGLTAGLLAVLPAGLLPAAAAAASSPDDTNR